MKKLFLMAAFAGLLTNTTVATTKGDDKGKDKNKKECCKKGTESKSCAGEKNAKGEKSCCKKSADASKTETKATDKK